MAGTSLLALIDDIASLLDDVATMTKVAAKETMGVLGDDLALNAQQVSGVRADRELPVVLAVAKGALKNKLILVPAALAASALAPWLVTPILMAGGAFLCFEGFEKLAHGITRGKAGHNDDHDHLKVLADPAIDMVDFERDKVRGAIRTDFILSAEIVAIALASVAHEPFGLRFAVVSGTAVIMTVGVYGLVAGIVKLDDGGLYLIRKRGADLASRLARGGGAALLLAVPYLMKGLSIAGMAAMFLVGGGILAHGAPGFGDIVHSAAHGTAALPGVGGFVAVFVPSLMKAFVGLLAGAVVVAIVGCWGLVARTIKSKQERSAVPADGQ